MNEDNKIKWGETGWTSLTVAEISQQADEKEAKRKKKFEEFKKENKVKGKQIAEKKTKDFLTESNDNTVIDVPGKIYNPHLKERAMTGAKSYAQLDPNWKAWSNTLAAIPLVVASLPALAAGGAGAVALGDAAASTAAGTALTGFLSNTAGRALGTRILGAPLYKWGLTGLDAAMVTHGANSVRQGEFTPMTALELSPAGKVASKIPDAHLGTMFFNNLPYSFMDKVNVGLKPINEALLTFVRSNPLHPIEGFDQARHVYRAANFQRLRYLASSRTPKVEEVLLPEGVTTNYQGNGLDLLRLRIVNTPNKYEPFYTSNGRVVGQRLFRFENTPIKTHISLKDAYDLNRSFGSNKITSFLGVPYTYVRANMGAGQYFTDANVIHINPARLKSLKFSLDDVKAHEMAHSLWHYTPYRNYIAPQYGPEYLPWFNYRGLPENVVEYLDANEIAARGTQLKNYFGITDNTPITGDMLKHAAKHYVENTGLNNNMNLFFRGITDWDKAAEWLSKYSYKKGGKICQKKKNVN